MANKIKKCATNRFWLKFYVFTVLTLGIYAIVFWVRWGKDLNRIKEKAGIEGKKLMNAFGAMILGIITLGIVPLTWMIKAVLRTYKAAEVAGTKKYGSVAKTLIFASLLSWTIICPILGFHSYCKTMNTVCKWYNEQLESAPAVEETPAALPEVEPTPAAEEPAPVVEETPAPVEETPAPAAEETPAPVKKTTKKPTTKKPAPAKKPEEEKTKAPAKKTTKKEKKVEEKPAPAVKPEKTGGVGANGAKIYHISKRKEDGKWQVKFANGSKAIKLFDTQAEAIDFAKTLAKNQEGSIRIHSVKGKIRK